MARHLVTLSGRHHDPRPTTDEVEPYGWNYGKDAEMWTTVTPTPVHVNGSHRAPVSMVKRAA